MCGQKETIFEEETKFLREAERIIENGQHGCDPLFEPYTLLVNRFGKFLREVEKIVKISDGQQVYLHRIQDDLRREIENRVKAEEKLRYLAAIDTLTGVYNRGMGITMLERQLKESARKKETFSLCYIDINGLKSVNDQYGHAEGDELLIIACQYVKEHLHEYDILCRLGGDEFLIILPHSRIDHAEAMIGNVKEAMDSDQSRLRKPYPVSFSYGIIQIDPDTKKTVEELIDLADRKMYKHKHRFHRLTARRYENSQG